MAPLVSVCIPVFNGERFIAAAIESALGQTLRDIEVVVVDNASTDGTPRIVAGFRDPRLRVFHNEQNIGAAGNFNRALSLAEGRYVKILCADDLLYPPCLEQQAAIFEGDARGAIAVVCCARDIIDGRGKRWLRRGFPGAAGRVDGRSAIARTVRSGTNVFGEPAAVLVRTSAARDAGGFDARYSYCIDLDLWTRLLARGDLQVIDETLCAFRISPQSWSATLAHRQHSEFADFVDDLARARGIPVSGLDRLSAGARAYLNARLRQAFTRVVFFSSRKP